MRPVRAALLLEVVVALAILVAAIGLLAAQLVSGLEMTSFAEDQFRAGLLADKLLGLVQLDPLMQRLMEESEELEFAFSDENPLGYALADAPGYFWRVTHEPVDREDQQKLRLVRIEVLRQRDRERLDSSDGVQVVRQLVFFKAAPAQVDLVEEAGLSEEAAEQLRMAIPIPGFDPRSVNFQQLMALLDRNTLMALLPLLQPLLQQLASGGLPAGLGDLAGQFGPGGEFAGFAEDHGLARKPNEMGDVSAEELAEMIRQAIAAGGQMPGGGGQPPQMPPGMRPQRTPPRPGQGPGRGGREGGPPPPAPEPEPMQGIDVGEGSGPNGEYTIEDLMRLRDAYERQQQQGGL